jgi:hypothetical protein
VSTRWKLDRDSLSRALVRVSGTNLGVTYVIDPDAMVVYLSDIQPV